MVAVGSKSGEVANGAGTEMAPVEKATAAPKKKAAAKKAAPKKKAVAKKATAKTTSTAKSGLTLRAQVFKLLMKSPMTGGQIKESLSLGGVPSLLKDEGVCDKPRIRRKIQEGVRGVVYELTALGRKDFEAGKVNENAAPASAGNDWK